MANVRTVWQQGSVSTTVEDAPSEELVQLMESTIVGTPGGIQYAHITAIDKLKRIRNCYFLLLKRSGRLLGSIGYHIRKTRTGDIDYKTWYVRYFYIQAPLRNTREYKLKKKRPLQERSVSLLKDVTHFIHGNPERLLDLDTQEVPRAVLFATIEAANERSRNFAGIGGYEAIADVHTIFFTRLIKRKRTVERLDPGEYEKMLGLLRAFYRNHSLYMEDYLFLNGDYYVLRRDGEIVAGLQANPESWEVKTIGSKFIDRIIKGLTRIPAVGKRFTYERLPFLGIEGVYFKKGHEKDLYRLLEGVLATTDHYLAMFVLDTRSPEYLMLKNRKKLGPVYTFLGTFKVILYAKFFSFTKEEKEEFLSKPAYLSIYDST